MTDDEFIDEVVALCRGVDGVEAVALGGSRARGDHRADSDWDFAIYYRGDIDVSAFEHTGWSGQVFRPFEWGQVMYGGAVFDLDGRHFDIHYRNIDVVEHWTRRAQQGDFEVHILAFHLAGIPTYMLTGELATNQVLWGDLPRPEYPEALQQTAPGRWLDRADLELDYAWYWAETENPAQLAGALARATAQCAHARVAHRGTWALNEKRLIQQAEFTDLYEIFASLGRTTHDLTEAIDRVKNAARAVRAETRAMSDPESVAARFSRS